jgi:glycosyltransferase involved in cell wall biosynthesis
VEPLSSHGRLRRAIGGALPQWLKPRLGEARQQYRPRPLAVPAAYSKTPPPDPAPTISLVTPSLNHGRYIEQTIASVLDQSYPRLEYVVMDGGSTDDSETILGTYRSRLHHLESGPDAGQANAINRGFEHTKGELMGWVNSDDVLLPGSLAYVTRVFARHPKVDLIYGHRILIDQQGRDVGLWITPRHSRDALRWFDLVPQEATFWRRRFWDRVGGIDERLSVAFDWELFLRFQEDNATIRRVPRLLGGFRLHPEQRTRREAETAQRELDSIREQWHGRHVSLDEARSRVDRFRRRSLPHYALRRLISAIPIGRSVVRYG